LFICFTSISGFWLSVNRTFRRFEINYLERRKVHAKTASQLHTRGVGCHPQASSDRTGPGFEPVRPVSGATDGFYNWQQRFFEKGAAAFTQGKDPKRKDTQRIEQLEEKLRKKHEALSELMEEHVKLKKELGCAGINRRRAGGESPPHERTS